MRPSSDTITAAILGPFQAAELAITHKLKVIHLHGDIGGKPAWEQLVRIATRWNGIQNYADKNPEGPWWLSVRRAGVVELKFAPGSAERA
jgi:hypothetical protein